MKKTGLIFFVVLAVFLGAGCASSGKVLLAQKEPIALVSIVSNGDVNWTGEEPTIPGRAGPLTQRTLRSDPELTIVTNTGEYVGAAEALFRNAVNNSNLITLADKGTVLASRAYGNARENKYQIYEEMTKPAGYRYIDFRDKAFPAALAEETGIERCMFVEFECTKVMAGGLGKNGNCKAGVKMKVFVLDAQGKKLYEKVRSLSSLDTIRVSNGAYSESELMYLFEATITELCGEFVRQLNS